MAWMVPAINNHLKHLHHLFGCTSTQLLRRLVDSQPIKVHSGAFLSAKHLLITETDCGKFYVCCAERFEKHGLILCQGAGDYGRRCISSVDAAV